MMEEKNEHDVYSPEQAAKLISDSLMKQPHDSAQFVIFINRIKGNEQFLLQLMKTIQPESIAFFENVIGICETRIKEQTDERKFKNCE